MRITGDGVEVFGLYGLAALLTLIGYGWAAGVAFRFRSIQAGPLMQTPVFLLLFLAPVYVPLSLLKGWIHAVASVNPATAFLDAGRGLISGVQDHTALAFLAALALLVLFAIWVLTGLRAAEDLIGARPRRARRGVALLSAASGALQLLHERVRHRRAHEHAPQRAGVVHCKRQRGHAAAHDERFVEVDRARHVVQPRQAQANFDARAHRVAQRIVDDAHVAHVGSRDAYVAQQAQHLLPRGEPYFDVLVAEADLHAGHPRA